MSKTQAKKKKNPVETFHSSNLLWSKRYLTSQWAGFEKTHDNSLQSGYRYADHFDAWVKEYHCILCAVHSVWCVPSNSFCCRQRWWVQSYLLAFRVTCGSLMVVSKESQIYSPYCMPHNIHTIQRLLPLFAYMFIQFLNWWLLYSMVTVC